MSALAGGCHCRAVRYRAEGIPERHGLCHCSDCRRHVGAPVVSWMIFRREQIAIEGELATYRSSEHGRRLFCPRCGTSLFYENAVVMPGMMDVQSATLDDPGAIPPTEQIQLVERIGWMKDAHALKGFERWPEEI